MRKLLTAAVLMMATAPFTLAAQEPEHVLKLHHFLPPASMAHSQIFVPWAERINEASEGRLRIDIYPAMQLGGKPPALFDQTRKGVTDISWTVAGWMPGRFPKGSVFELPFMVTDAEGTSRAIHEYAQTEMQDELKDVHLLALHTHARGSLHSREKALTTGADLDGLRVHVANKNMAAMIKSLGASPTFIPVTQVPSSLSKGVIDVSVLPFEVIAPLRIYEMVEHHLEVPGPRGLYTQFFIFSMNKDTYAGLPDDLKAVIDANSGAELAGLMGAKFDEYESVGREPAVSRGNQFATLSEEERARWIETMQPITQAWVDARNEEFGDGDTLYNKANALLDKYSSAP